MHSEAVLNSIKRDLHNEVEKWKQRMLKKIQHDTEAMLELIDVNIVRLHEILKEDSDDKNRDK